MITDEASYLAYSIGWQAVRRMPASMAYGLFDRLAVQTWRRRSKGVRQLERNLSRVSGRAENDPVVRELARDGLRSYMRYWCDAFRLPGWDEAAVTDFVFHGEQIMIDHIASGRGVIAVLGHTGNWDHVGAYACKRIAPVMTVAEQLKPAKLYQAFVSYRESLGMTILGLGEPGVYERLREHAAGGGLVALLGDRDLSARGIDVDFFGSRARFPAGAAALAVDTGAALLPVSLFTTTREPGDRLVNAGRVMPEVTPPEHGARQARIAATTQLVADSLAVGIREHPADWHMLQKLWLADLDPARLAAADAAGGR